MSQFSYNIIITIILIVTN